MIISGYQFPWYYDAQTLSKHDLKALRISALAFVLPIVENWHLDYYLYVC